MNQAIVPATLIAGDTWTFSYWNSDYPADGGWTAKVYFENGSQTFSATASASGSDHAFSIAATTTAGYKAGRYKWFVRVTSGANAYTVAEGWTDIDADPAAAGTRDRRSWAKRALDAVEASIEGRATDAQQSFTIRDRSVSRIPLKELMELRTQLRQEVRTEEQGERAGLGRNIKARFSRG